MKTKLFLFSKNITKNKYYGMAYQDLSRENLEEREEVVSISQVLKQVPHAPASLTTLTG
jgi:hypothetical protein